MREWSEPEMSFSAGGVLSSSDGFCSTEPLQYYGESSAASPLPHRPPQSFVLGGCRLSDLACSFGVFVFS